jgi:ADP-glucose pyrophosphorylase
MTDQCKTCMSWRVKCICEKNLVHCRRWRFLKQFASGNEFPECDEKVIILTKDLKIYVAKFDNYSDDYGSVSDFWLADIDLGKAGKILLASNNDLPIAWMPLPELPK